VGETPGAGKKMTAGDPPQHPPTHSDGNEPARDEPKGSLEPDRQFYWLGSRARPGRGKSCFEAEARGQEAVHGHVNFLVCVYASVNQSDTSDRPEEFSAASASECAVLRTCFV
jgi:hypothetical protein